MVKSPKIIFSFVIPLIIFFVFGILNLGCFLDITKEPILADIIVCLGGGEQERIEKSIELYRQGYSKENKLLLVGSYSSHAHYAKKYAPNVRYITHSGPVNTANEIFYIKTLMKTHHYKSALIVSEPTHSRRVMMLSRLISIDGDEDFLFIPVSSGVEWWDRRKYFLNGQTISMAFLEMAKMINSYFIYGTFGRLST